MSSSSGSNLDVLPIATQTARAIQDMGCVVVHLAPQEGGRLIISGTSAPTLDRLVVGRSVGALTGAEVATSIETWARSEPHTAPPPFIAIAPISDDTDLSRNPKLRRFRYRVVMGSLSSTFGCILVVEAIDDHELFSRSPEPAAQPDLAAIAHELRTPLNGILAMSDLLGARPLGPLDRELVDLLRESSRALNGLLNRLLRDALAASTASDPSEPPLQAEVFDLAGLVRSVSGVWAATAARKGLTFSRQGVQLHPSMVIGDPVKLRQVLDNLMGNAVKFTDRGSVSVRLDTKSTANSVQLCRIIVEDTGGGFDPTARARLFERGAAVGRNHGAGLGLHISLGIIERMNGRINVETAESGGARVIVELPLREAAHLPAREDETA